MRSLSRRVELTELHVHLGGSVDPAIMWSIAHSQGIRLPTKNYWEFVDMITIRRGRVKSFEEYLKMFHWTELIQSSPLAVERSVYETIGGAYRKNNITTLELRYNPMKRNRGGEQDLDHIILASLRGMDRALLEYPVKAGIIICLDKSYDYRLNEILVEKAIMYRDRGIIGIDVAGPRAPGFRYEDYTRLVRRAKDAGLGVTVHAGEDEGFDSVRKVLHTLEPDRIGHGVKAVGDERTLELLCRSGVLLEVCPSSNVHTGVVESYSEFRRIFAVFKKYGVKFSLNTDGPEMLRTNLRREIMLSIKHRCLSPEDIIESNGWARDASFIDR
jgi:adenosine deaminase